MVEFQKRPRRWLNESPVSLRRIEHGRVYHRRIFRQYELCAWHSHVANPALDAPVASVGAFFSLAISIDSRASLGAEPALSGRLSHHGVSHVAHVEMVAPMARQSSPFAV